MVMSEDWRGHDDGLWEPLWSDLSNKIDRELPGEPFWSQAIPVEGDSAEGLAIRRAGEGYLLVYFRLLPARVDPETPEEMLGEGPFEADDWDLEVGYQEPFTSLQEAKDEAGEILAGLPTPEHMQERGYDFFLKLLEEPT